MEGLRRSLRNKLLGRIRIFNKRIFNKITIALAQSGRGPFSLLRHAGRRTGAIYTTPVLATYVGDTVLIPLSYGEEVDWLRNVLAAGACDILWKSETMRAEEPQVVAGESALSILPEGRRRLFKRFEVDKFLRMKRAGPGKGR